MKIVTITFPFILEAILPLIEVLQANRSTIDILQNFFGSLIQIIQFSDISSKEQFAYYIKLLLYLLHCLCLILSLLDEKKIELLLNLFDSILFNITGLIIYLYSQLHLYLSQFDYISYLLNFMQCLETLYF